MPDLLEPPPRLDLPMFAYGPDKPDQPAHDLLGAEFAARRTEVEAQMRADRAVGMAPSTTSQKPTSSPEAGW